MVTTTVLNAFDNGTGAYRFKRRNRGGMYRKLPVHNDLDDYHDVSIGEKEYEVFRMSRWKSFSYDHRRIYLLLKVLGVVIISIMVLGIVGSGLLRFVFIPLEIQSYYPLYGKEKIGSLILQKQQILNPKLLAQLTYINANGQSQIAIDKQYGNGVILEGAFLGLPGFGAPGGESGIKMVGMDIQQINAASTSNDPPVLSSNALQLNGGTDGFFNYAQKTRLPLVQAMLNTYPIGPISGSNAQCFNIYATLEPTFALSAEPVPGQCESPFTHSQH